MDEFKYYIVTQDYEEETSDEIALTPNLDHSSIFPTGDGFWEEVKAICDKHNALFYQPENEKSFLFVHMKYRYKNLHAGMFLEDGKWKTCKGTDVTFFFWDRTEPSDDADKKCGIITDQNRMGNRRCDSERLRGLCVY